jgi:hypothetical protein
VFGNASSTAYKPKQMLRVNSMCPSFTIFIGTNYPHRKSN